MLCLKVWENNVHDIVRELYFSTIMKKYSRHISNNYSLSCRKMNICMPYTLKHTFQTIFKMYNKI